MKPSRVTNKRPIGRPSEAELRRVDKLLRNAKANRGLKPNATHVEKFKYEVCRQFVIYLRESQLSQRNLAKKLKVSEARVSEIVRYHFDKITIDRLIGYLGIIRPNVRLLIEN